MEKANKNRKINHTKDDKKIAEVWFGYTPSKDTVQGECKRLDLGAPFRGDKKSEEAWINYFAEKLLKNKLVTLMKTYDNNTRLCYLGFWYIATCINL